MSVHYIKPERIDFQQIAKILNNNCQLALSEEAKEKIVKCRTYLDNKMAEKGAPIYGVNTGFGSLCDVTIQPDELSSLQENLVMSHACGTGDPIAKEIVKIMLLLKIQSVSYGHSGVQLCTVERLVEFFNNDILPVVYEMGSLGASGDLAPLAHMSLPLLGKGEVYYKGEVVSSESVLKEFNWEVITLQSKEGLALLNGTQFMNAFSVYNVLRSKKLLVLSDIIAALSLEAFDGLISPFHPLIQEVRPHNGQKVTASRFRNLLEGSELINRKKAYVQDPYSFRCIPQVHGASKDAFDYVYKTIDNELNAVTDNPTIFPDEDLVISAGNFHGQPLALSLDNLCIAMAELGNISDRRTYQLISGKRGLPPFLVANSGLNSGFMIPQYTAASIVSQNKQLCTPASVDSIESSQGQEDHVSMGANAATKSYKVINNVERVLAIELFNASQALAFRAPVKTSAYLEDFVAKYREVVPFVENDRILFYDIKNSVDFLKKIALDLPNEEAFAYDISNY